MQFTISPDDIGIQGSIKNKEVSLPRPPACADLFTKVVLANGGLNFANYIEQSDRGGICQQRPISFELIAPALCQHNCEYCSAAVRRTVLERSIALDGKELSSSTEKEERMKGLLDEIAGLGAKGLVWSGGGDWAIYGEWFPRVLEYAKSIGIAESMWISHFAARLYKVEEFDRIVQSCVSLRASVDGPDIETYNAIRNPKNKRAFDVMRYNVKGLLEARQRTGSKARIGIQMVLVKKNIGKVAEMVAFAEQLGVDYIQIRPVELTGEQETEVDPALKGMQTYNGIYDDMHIFQKVDALCAELQKSHKVKILYRLDKAGSLKSSDIVETPQRPTERCHGCLMQGVLQMTPAMGAELLHCYFRDEYRMPVIPGMLRATLYSDERQSWIGAVDATPKKCSNGCKYVDLNTRVQRLLKMSVSERQKELRSIVDSGIEVIDPNII